MSESFCILPFIHHHIDVEGNTKLCCFAEPSKNLKHFGDDTHIDLRKKFLSGEKPKECYKCWKQESRNQISHRQMENKKWSNLLSHTPDIDNKKIYTVHYAFSNHCNLACVMCGPVCSSTWGKIMKNDKIVHATTIEDIDTSHVKHAYLAGGEPLTIPAFKRFVEKLEPDVEVVVNSNLTKLSDDWIKLLSKFKKKCVTVSVEAHGKLNEYIRWPMNWEEFDQNVKKLQSANIPIMFNTVLMNINFLDVEKLFDWMVQYDPNTVNIEEVVYPKEFNFDYLKQNYRSKFVEFCEKLSRHPLVRRFIHLQMFFQQQKHNVDNFDQSSKNQILEILNTQDTLKNTKFDSIDCEFNKL